MNKLFKNTLKIAKNPLFWLGVILFFGFFVRLYKIDNPVADWHSWRQGDTASVARIYLEDGIDLLKPRYHDVSFLQTGKPNPEGLRFVEFPIFSLIHVLFITIFPQLSLEMWGRLVSVIASTFSIGLIFLIGRRFLGTAGGLISAFFFAFIPFNIFFSRVILPEPLSVTFALASLYFFVKWFDYGNRAILITSGVFFALAMLVKPYTIFYGVPMLMLASARFKWQWKKMFKNKDLWTFAIVALAPVFAWRVWMMQFPEGIPFYTWVFNSDGIRFKPSFWYWIFNKRIGQMILGSWGILAFSIGILVKPKKLDDWFIPTFAFGMFLYVSIIATANVRHDYYQTLIIPAVALILARGVLYLWNTTEFPQPITKLFMLATITWGLFFSSYQIREFYKINHPEIIRAGQALDEIAPRDAQVVAPYNGDTAFLYQTKRVGWPYQTNSIEQMIQAGADYYISVNLNDPQTQDVMRKFEIPIETEEYVIIDLSKKRLPDGG